MDYGLFGVRFLLLNIKKELLLHMKRMWLILIKKNYMQHSGMKVQSIFMKRKDINGCQKNLLNIHDVETWQNTILKTFEEDIAEINEKIETKKAKYEQVKNNDKKEAYRLNEDLSKLEKLKKLFYQLELSESEKRLLNNSILIVEGKSGIGKSDLFANEANLMLKAGENEL